MIPESKNIDWIAYGFAWLKYIGAIFSTAGGLGDTVRNAFINIHIPQKDDYIKGGTNI
jgi:hypothetical protein